MVFAMMNVEEVVVGEGIGAAAAAEEEEHWSHDWAVEVAAVEEERYWYNSTLWNEDGLRVLDQI